MHPRRIPSVLLMAATTSVLVASGVQAQQAPPEPVRVMQVRPDDPGLDAEVRREELEELRAELQEVYERLFELQVRYQASGNDAAVLDSLSVEREELRARVDDLSDRIAVANRERRSTLPPAPRHGEADVYLLFEQLANPESGLDPQELGRIFESGEGIGEVLAIIGEQIKNMEVEISEDRVRIDTGTGGRFSIKVPEDLREELSAGMREIGRELNRGTADSNGGARNWANLIEQLPDRIAQGWPERRGSRRKVVAESAFSIGSDFEVADDEIVQGDVLLIGADAYVSGEVQGNVYVLFGDLLVEEQGLIAEDAISVGGRVLVDDRAEILGRRLDFGDLGGLVGGPGKRGGLAWALYAGRLLLLLALLLLVYALFGERMANMVESGAEQPGRTMISGAVWFTSVFGLFVLAAVGLAVSVIGIPVVLVLAAAMGLVCTMAYLAGCELVGRRLAELVRPGVGVTSGWLGAVLGVALFELPAIAGLILGTAGVDGLVLRPLTALEIVIRFLALSIGFGAVVHTRLGRRQPGPESIESGADAISAGV